MPPTIYKIGDLIENRYRVLAANKSGGMGMLYRVADEAKDNEIIALKAIRLDLPPGDISSYMESFNREFQILAQLRHPNLVSVYDYGVTARGEIYFTMEWIEGSGIRLHADRRPLKTKDICPAIAQICRALNYLHARGVTHGDLKPSNILLGNNQIKLIDFGISIEFMNAEARGHYFTPFYSAPELKERRAVDQRADLYSLGAVWYALLIGEPPMFMRGDERLIQKEIEDYIEIDGELPIALAAVISRLLSISPNNRYNSANEVIEAINEICATDYALETRETAGSYALRAHFVGRDPEFKVLRSAWEGARNGSSGIILIGAPSGMGKTRLVEEFVVHAQLEGARVARGRCIATDSAAYRPWREVLRILVRHAESDEGKKTKRAMAVLSTLLPELRKRDYLKGVTLPVELDAQTAQQRLNDAAIHILREAASIRPTLIVIEDAHWADEATLSLLTALTRIQGTANLLTCITYQNEEIGAEHTLSILSGQSVRRVNLDPLPSEACARLVASMLGMQKLPSLLTKRVQQISAGNPFFVQELVREMAENGVVLKRTVSGWRLDRDALQEAQLPASIHQTVGRRLERLSPLARNGLRWAATLGSVFWDKAVEEIGEISETETNAAIQEGIRAGLIAEQERSAFEFAREYAFVNSTIREVNYDLFDATPREDAHRRAADWLIQRGAERADEHLSLIATHLERANDATRAAIYLKRAGEQAAAQFANAEALDAFARALDLLSETALTDRYEILSQREKIFDLQGSRESQILDLNTLEEIAESLNDNDRRIDLALRRASYFGSIGDYPTAITVAENAIRLAHEIGDTQNEAKGYLLWGRSLWFQGNHKESQAQLERALALETKDSIVRADALRILGMNWEAQGDYENGFVRNRESLRICREIGDKVGESSSLNNLGAASAEQGHLTEARTYFDESFEISEKLGDRQGENIALANLATISRDMGDYQKAKRYSEQALNGFREIGDRWSESYILTMLANLYHDLGDHKTAHNFCKQSLQIGREVGALTLQDSALTVLGHVLSALGDLSGAASAYKEALALQKDEGRINHSMETLAGMTRLHLIQGADKEVQACVNEIMDYLEGRAPAGVNMQYVYLTVFQALSKFNDPRARQILEKAHRLLMDQADKLNDEEIKRRFLENVPPHRAILDEMKSPK